MAEYKGIEYLRSKLNARRQRVLTRYKYYEMKNARLDPSPIIPDRMKADYVSVLGWCSKAVDALADRLTFREFKEDNFEINEIFQMNNPDVFFDSAILSALITSCCFVYISQDETGYPRLQVIDGGNATGEIDPITGLLTEGYAVLQRDSDDNVVLEAYFVKGRTDYYESKREPYSVSNDAPAPLLVPVIYKPDAKRPFGHSRISRACMNVMDKARNTITRTEVASEFYSFPQRYVLGTSNEAEPLDKWKTTITELLEITKDEDGDHPTAGVFQQQSMEPGISQLRMYASVFAGETGLTLDDLGFATDNPSSSDAIAAAHENLRLAARKAQRTFGSGFLNVGYLAACLRDEYAYQRRQFYMTQAVWAPVFEPDFAAFSTFGDGVQKLTQAAPGYFGMDNMREMLGIEPSKEPFPVESGE
ncbi:MAG: phage portal protein [Lachnospiraceae bacterium]|nr:phage portal protein [Lachnospiraceae bacterium]